MKKVEITLKRGLAGWSERDKATVRSLGLKKPGDRVIRVLDNVTLGMVRKVAHLVEVKEIGEVEKQ
ncbi:MAG: 50S ribosomal protein L30 [Thermosulfidibacteraceae bacterium]